MDIQSTDTMHWAKNLVATAKENNFTLEEVLDESWLVGWFANYWAAVHDPLQREVERLKEALEELSTTDDEGLCDSGNHAFYVAQQALKKGVNDEQKPGTI